MDENYERITTPEFDSSFSTLARINFELWQCNNAKRKDDIPNWLKSLDNIFDEIEAHVTKEIELKELMQQREITLKSFEEYIRYVRNFSMMPEDTAFAPPRRVFDNLRKWELMLKRNKFLMNLLMKMSEDASRAML